jgi:hypothetical protein
MPTDRKAEIKLRVYGELLFSKMMVKKKKS